MGNRLFDAKTGEAIVLEDGFLHGLIGVAAVSPDGRLLAEYTYQGITIWEPLAQVKVRTLATGVGIGTLAFSPDGTVLARASKAERLFGT